MKSLGFIKLNVVVLAAVLFVFALAQEAYAGEQRPHQYIVFGADRTGSYKDMTGLALRIAEGFVRKAQPGDEMYFRWISGNSYKVDQVFAHLRLPAMKLSTVRNSYDRRAKYQQALLKQRITQIIRMRKRNALLQIRKQCPGSTGRTDIYGFITAAADQFTSAPSDASRILVLATDLDDNRRYKIQPDLSNVAVYVYPVKNDPDPARMKAKKDHWESYFKASGAISVRFVTPDVFGDAKGVRKCTK